jgi:hypothetical protein
MRRTTGNTSLLTTNQKVAGSSPAERAPKSLCRGCCQRLRRAALDRRMFAPVSCGQGTTREIALVHVR